MGERPRLSVMLRLDDGSDMEVTGVLELVVRHTWGGPCLLWFEDCHLSIAAPAAREER